MNRRGNKSSENSNLKLKIKIGFQRNDDQADWLKFQCYVLKPRRWTQTDNKKLRDNLQDEQGS